MTPEQNNGRKARMFALVGVGIAAMIGAYSFPSNDVGSSVTGVIFVVAGLICFVIAARMARKMKQEEIK